MMMIEEYKETILHELQQAGDQKEVEKIINRSVQQMSEKDLFRHLVITYLQILQTELQKSSGQNVDSPGKHNIRNALNYLRQMNQNRERIE